jgi:hypothetical protein
VKSGRDLETGCPVDLGLATGFSGGQPVGRFVVKCWWATRLPSVTDSSIDRSAEEGPGSLVRTGCSTWGGGKRGRGVAS